VRDAGGSRANLKFALLSWSVRRIPLTGSQLTGEGRDIFLLTKLPQSVELAAFYAHKKVVQEQQMLN
jgi:hypothetical protein